MNSIVCSFGHL